MPSFMLVDPVISEELKHTDTLRELSFILYAINKWLKIGMSKVCALYEEGKYPSALAFTSLCFPRYGQQ